MTLGRVSSARLLVLVLALLAPACADEGTVASPSTRSASVSATGSPTDSTDPQPTETGSPEPTQSTGPSETPAPELEDGKHFGFIRSIDVAAQTMRFDLAYFLTGDEANQAAAEHGDEAPVPNDYYIVNDNPRLRTLAIAPDAEVWVIDWTACCDLVPGEIQPFVDAFATRHHAWDALYQGSQAPYWLTVESGIVVKIEVQYLP